MVAAGGVLYGIAGTDLFGYVTATAMADAPEEYVVAILDAGGTEVLECSPRTGLLPCRSLWEGLWMAYPSLRMRTEGSAPPSHVRGQAGLPTIEAPTE